MAHPTPDPDCLAITAATLLSAYPHDAVRPDTDREFYANAVAAAAKLHAAAIELVEEHEEDLGPPLFPSAGPVQGGAVMFAEEPSLVQHGEPGRGKSEHVDPPKCRGAVFTIPDEVAARSRTGELVHLLETASPTFTVERLLDGRRLTGEQAAYLHKLIDDADMSDSPSGTEREWVHHDHLADEQRRRAEVEDTLRRVQEHEAELEAQVDRFRVDSEQATRNLTDLVELMAYVDDAKAAAEQYGRVSGQPLADAFHELGGDLSTVVAERDALADAVRQVRDLIAAASAERHTARLEDVLARVAPILGAAAPLLTHEPRHLLAPRSVEVRVDRLVDTLRTIRDHLTDHAPMPACAAIADTLRAAEDLFAGEQPVERILAGVKLEPMHGPGGVVVENAATGDRMTIATGAELPRGTWTLHSVAEHPAPTDGWSHDGRVHTGTPNVDDLQRALDLALAGERELAELVDLLGDTCSAVRADLDEPGEDADRIRKARRRFSPRRVRDAIDASARIAREHTVGGEQSLEHDRDELARSIQAFLTGKLGEHLAPEEVDWLGIALKVSPDDGDRIAALARRLAYTRSQAGYLGAVPPSTHGKPYAVVDLEGGEHSPAVVHVPTGRLALELVDVARLVTEGDPGDMDGVRRLLERVRHARAKWGPHNAGFLPDARRGILACEVIEVVDAERAAASWMRNDDETPYAKRYDDLGDEILDVAAVAFRWSVTHANERPGEVGAAEAHARRIPDNPDGSCGACSALPGMQHSSGCVNMAANLAGSRA